MSKKSAKKRQPVVKPAVQEAMSAAVPLGSRCPVVMPGRYY